MPSARADEFRRAASRLGLRRVPAGSLITADKFGGLRCQQDATAPFGRSSVIGGLAEPPFYFDKLNSCRW